MGGYAIVCHLFVTGGCKWPLPSDTDHPAWRCLIPYLPSPAGVDRDIHHENVCPYRSLCIRSCAPAAGERGWVVDVAVCVLCCTCRVLAPAGLDTALCVHAPLSAFQCSPWPFGEEGTGALSDCSS